MKKAQGFGLLGGIIILLLIFAAVGVAYFLITGNGTNILNALADKYTKPNIAPNDYFTALYIGFASNGQPLQSGQVPSGCSSTGTGKYSCPVGTSIELYVGLKNTGGSQVSLYADPLAGFNCQGTSDSCQSEDWIDGNYACLTIPGGSTVDCPTKNLYVLSKKGKYRIFAGGKCLKQDCFDPEHPTTNDVQYENPTNYIEITTS